MFGYQPEDPVEKTLLSVRLGFPTANVIFRRPPPISWNSESSSCHWMVASRLESRIQHLETTGLEAPRTGTLSKLKLKRKGLYCTINFECPGVERLVWDYRLWSGRVQDARVGLWNCRKPVQQMKRKWRSSARTPNLRQLKYDSNTWHFPFYHAFVKLQCRKQSIISFGIG